MDINSSYWDDSSNIQHMKYESCNSDEQPRLKDEPLYRCCDSNLNFATVACSEDDSEYGQYKKSKVSRQDPMSHRIIEKRRRDRMNNCLADLSRLIPVDYLKKGRGRIEKTEIIEMAIKHIKYLQQINKVSGREEMERSYSHEQYRLGYQECMSETMRFLVEVEGYFARESLCVKLINHLQKHCDHLLLRDRDSSTNIQVEKDFNQESSISNTIASNMSIRIPSPGRQMSDQFDSSQLRDMLTGTVLREDMHKQITENLQLKSLSREIILIPREPSPDNEKHDQHVFKKGPEFEFQKSQQDMSETNVNKNMCVSQSETMSENESYDKNRDCSNGVYLYKFKNNIKQRFSQDLSAESIQSKEFKRQKMMESVRRNSMTTETYSSENHSSPIDSSQCSPPSSEMYRMSSESENARISPSGSSVSDTRNIDRRTPNRYTHLKPELNKNGFGRYSPTVKHFKSNLPSTQSHDSDLVNFSVPIFALHAKGSFYIPLTIDYNTLMPFLQHHNILEVMPNVHNIILHPVTINVNFQSNYISSLNTQSIKSNKHKIEGQNGWN